MEDNSYEIFKDIPEYIGIYKANGIFLIIFDNNLPIWKKKE